MEDNGEKFVTWKDAKEHITDPIMERISSLERRVALFAGGVLVAQFVIVIGVAIFA